MLQTIWYALLLLLQALQTDPQVHGRTVYMDVYMGGKLAYNLQFKGSFTDGVISDAKTNATFGAFESLRRDGRKITVLPATDVADSGKDSPGGNASPAPSGISTKATKPALPAPFILDFAPVLSALATVNQKPVLTFQVPVFGDKDSADQAKAEKPPLTSKTLELGKKPATSDPSGSASEETADNTMTLLRYPSYWALSVESAAMVIILTVR